MMGDIDRAALPLGDDLEPVDEFVGGIFEGLASLHLSAPDFAVKLQIPVLGKILAWARLSSFVLTRWFFPPRKVEHCQ